MFAKCEERVSRPLAVTVHSKDPNEVHHMDYIYVGAETDRRRYALVVKDDLSG